MGLGLPLGLSPPPGPARGGRGLLGGDGNGLQRLQPALPVLAGRRRGGGRGGGRRGDGHDLGFRGVLGRRNLPILLRPAS